MRKEIYFLIDSAQLDNRIETYSTGYAIEQWYVMLVMTDNI